MMLRDAVQSSRVMHLPWAPPCLSFMSGLYSCATLDALSPSYFRFQISSHNNTATEPQSSSMSHIRLVWQSLNKPISRYLE